MKNNLGLKIPFHPGNYDFFCLTPKSKSPMVNWFYWSGHTPLKVTQILKWNLNSIASPLKTDFSSEHVENGIQIRKKVKEYFREIGSIKYTNLNNMVGTSQLKFKAVGAMFFRGWCKGTLKFS